jgi:hypothetical protein
LSTLKKQKMAQELSPSPSAVSISPSNSFIIEETVDFLYAEKSLKT